jgi:hypothetical protein
VITADQHQSLFDGSGPPALVQSEPLADYINYVPFVASVDRQNSFDVKDVGRKPPEKALKRFGNKGPLVLESSRASSSSNNRDHCRGLLPRVVTANLFVYQNRVFDEFMRMRLDVGSRKKEQPCDEH